MSLLSRLFRKAPPPALPPKKAPEPAAGARPAQATPDRATVAARAATAAKEEEALKAAIDGRDTPAIARTVLEGSSTKIRQLAAHAVDDLEILRQLIRDARGGNDKSVYRILTAKRDAELEKTRQQEQLRADIAAVAASIERHSRRAYDALFTPTLEQLEGRWRGVASNADAALAQRVQDAIDASREVIAQHLRQIAAEASRELAAANAAAEAQRLRELEEKAAATANAERAALAAAERKALAEKREAEALALRQLGGLVRKAHLALGDGSTGRAAGLRRAIDERLAGAPPLPPYLTNQLQQLDAKLDELKDWKNFSVTPKRVELMEEIESLIGATLDPAVLADRIKALQEEWRTLSKGAGENLEADWQRFQEAAQKAYQPCREYFESQALVRQENLQRREALLARLSAFETGHDWEKPDWRLVVTALRESRQQWRQHSPVERAAGKALQQQFDAVSANLQRRLDAEYSRNVEQKKSLIERAQSLLTTDDSRAAIDTCKSLQQSWKSVGPVPRDEDHRLWEEFRQHCDGVFQRRQQEFTEYSAGLEDNKAKAVAWCEELEQIGALNGPGLLVAAARVADIQAAFEAAGEFPRGAARALRGRFERGLEQCERAVAEQREREAEQSWTDLLDAADKVRAYRLTVVRNGEQADRDTLRAAAESHITAVPKWPKGAVEALRRELDREGGSDVAANEAALRELCIRAEILTDTATPPEDQPLRREYQVQRLLRNMGQGSSAEEAHIDALTIDWVGVGPTEQATYTALLSRLKRCRQRLGS
jgi:hypothetical protein